MKTRNGFVSNSSVSSFIVHHIVDFTSPKEKKELLNSETIDLLVKHGFRVTGTTNPSDLPLNSDSFIAPLKDVETGEILILNYGLSVVCNQDDVLYFLLKNNISFIASCHYDEEVYLYQKDNDYVLRMMNFGVSIASFHYDESYDQIVSLYKDITPIEKISKVKFLGEQEHFMSEWKKDTGEEYEDEVGFCK
jgi:hypothetical protein